jgi:hypothetical protein
MSMGFSFSIGNLGYAGCGYDLNFQPRQDFWEYNPATNTWTQKADFPGGNRTALSSFSVNNMGYAGMGSDFLFDVYNDLWQYDPALDSWTQKTSLPAIHGRSGTSTFVIGNSAYFAGGALLRTLWEYNTVTDTWTQRPDIPFPNRSFTVAFSLCNKGYFGTGTSGGSYLSDILQYDPVTNTWSPKTSYPAVGGRMSMSYFVIGQKAYVGMGQNDFTVYSDFYEYTPDPCVTGIEEFSSSDLQLTVSPNPVRDILSVNYSLKGNENVNATITDIHGKVVYEFPLPTASDHATVSLEKFAGGMYFLKVKNEVRRFVVTVRD